MKPRGTYSKVMAFRAVVLKKVFWVIKVRLCNTYPDHKAIICYILSGSR